MVANKNSSEDRIPIGQAREFFPQPRPALASLYRWCLVGIHGVRLRHQRIGKRYFTTAAWCAEFIEATTAACIASANAASPPLVDDSAIAPASANRRQVDIAAAEGKWKSLAQKVA
jgi:hypothetical protein